MGTSLARRGAVRHHSVGPHVAAGLTDRTGIVAASVPDDPAPDTRAPAPWRGRRMSSAVLWAGAVMLFVLTLSSGISEQPPPAKVVSAQPPRSGSAKTLLPPAPTPVPRPSPSGDEVQPHVSTRAAPEKSAPVAADPTTPPAAPAPETVAEAEKRSSGTAGALVEQVLPAAGPSAVESRVEDQVADEAEEVVEPVRRAVDTAFGMLLDITEQ